MGKTRHSVGMQAVDRLADVFQQPWKRERQLDGFIARITKSNADSSVDVILLKPILFMNINGRSVAKTVSAFGVSMKHILLIQDDLNKPVGKYRMKMAGSAGGHNGVRSVVSALGTDDIPRLRIGIDRPTSKNDVVEYVLHNFSRQDSQIIKENMDGALKLALSHLASRCGFGVELFGEQFVDSAMKERSRKSASNLNGESSTAEKLDSVHVDTVDEVSSEKVLETNSVDGVDTHYKRKKRDRKTSEGGH